MAESNKASISAGLLTITWTDWTPSVASLWRAAGTSVVWNISQIFQFGSKASIATYSIILAKLSLSHRLSHHFIVTKSPNHWWANSWAITVATNCFISNEVLSGSSNKYASR